MSNPYESTQFGAGPDPDILNRVSGPAIGLMVVAGVGIALQLIALAINITGVGMDGAGADGPPMMMQGPVAIVSSLMGIAVGVLVLSDAAVKGAFR